MENGSTDSYACDENSHQDNKPDSFGTTMESNDIQYNVIKTDSAELNKLHAADQKPMPKESPIVVNGFENEANKTDYKLECNNNDKGVNLTAMRSEPTCSTSSHCSAGNEHMDCCAGPSGLQLSFKNLSIQSDEYKSSFKNPFCDSTSEMKNLVQTKITNYLQRTEIEEDSSSGIRYVCYQEESQMKEIMRLIQKDLSEPYSIYTYRYFIYNWPHLCYLAIAGDEYVGAIICKIEFHRKVIKRGYIAMLAVDQNYRKRKIGSTLVNKAIRSMYLEDADEVVLETEVTNHAALKLYENLGFVRDKRLFRYYLNGVDALRLKLWFK